MTTNKSKSKPEVKFQYGGRPHSQIVSRNNSRLEISHRNLVRSRHRSITFLSIALKLQLHRVEPITITITTIFQSELITPLLALLPNSTGTLIVRNCNRYRK